jgi:hypothetical protein
MSFQGAHVRAFARFHVPIFPALSFCPRGAHARASAINRTPTTPTGSPDAVLSESTSLPKPAPDAQSASRMVLRNVSAGAVA